MAPGLQNFLLRRIGQGYRHDPGGSDAVEVGLINAVGGLARAVAKLRELINARKTAH